MLGTGMSRLQGERILSRSGVCLHGFRTIHEKDNVAYGLFYPILLADLAISFGVETAFMPLKAISNLFGPGSSAQSDIKDHSAGKTSANPE
jgi:hypothetical protein